MKPRGMLAIIGVAVVGVAVLMIWSGRPATAPAPAQMTATAAPTGVVSVPAAATKSAEGTSGLSATETPAAAPAVVPIIVTPPAVSAGRRPMTVYAVRNPNATAITVEHVLTDTAGFRHTFTSTVGAGETAEYHLRDIAAVPSPFDGALTLNAALPFTATVVGYDYAEPPVTTPVEPTPTRTP